MKTISPIKLQGINSENNILRVGPCLVFSNLNSTIRIC